MARKLSLVLRASYPTGRLVLRTCTWFLSYCDRGHAALYALSSCLLDRDHQCALRLGSSGFALDWCCDDGHHDRCFFENHDQNYDARCRVLRCDGSPVLDCLDRVLLKRSALRAVGCHLCTPDGLGLCLGHGCVVFHRPCHRDRDLRTIVWSFHVCA